MSTMKVSQKGWVVIPREIRERYGIRPGDKVQVVDYGGSIAVIPALRDPVRELRGMFKGGPSLTKALLEERRRNRRREDQKLKRITSRRRNSA